MTTATKPCELLYLMRITSQLLTSTQILVTMLDVKVDPMGDPRLLRRLDRLRAEECSDSDKQEPKRQFPKDHFWWLW